jgi:DNA polymerase-3 subunit delta
VTLQAFLGNDELRKQEALEAAVAAFMGGGGGGCIREVHFGEELKWEQVAESYRTADLFAPRKALVIKNWDKIHLANQKHLEEVFKEGNPEVGVFLSAEKWDGRSKFAKAVQAAGGVQEFKLPYDNQIPGWLSQRAQQKYGRRLGAAEARILQDLVGNKLEELDHELEKLDTFLPKGRAIAAADIEELVSPLKVFNQFEFNRVMGHRRKAEFLPALRALLEDDKPAFLVAQMLFSHFLTLLKIRACQDQGMGPDGIVDSLKLNRFLHVQKEGYLEQARSRSQEQWKRILARLARMEREMKQGRYAHRFEVELAFASLV